ncbi:MULTISPECIES: oxidoreductase [Prochlorococcus]|uniref:oxidoreductase n=1 Tax=Prochlorococcus TaxID=1218 RepID=UPI0005338D48|nr:MULTISPECIES: oxidoreductase [Prochlorococcus]KGG14161.1 Short-chain dehydrogenase/reductase (SDR) [Prochlorococcus sp. MIT 0601]
MTWSFNSIPCQEGRIAFITGANSGLGLDTAYALLSKGATVILGCRNIEKAEQAREKLVDGTGSQTVEVLQIDLSDLENVNRALEKIALKYTKLDLLINNAGVMAPPQTFSKQRLELQFAVNHISHMALTLNLLPLLAKKPGGRVVTVSSGAQYMGKINWEDLQGEKKYDRWKAYSQSKLANVMFALELSERIKAACLDLASLAAHPGLARTNLQSTSIKSNGSWQEAIAYKLINPIFQSSRMGSLPQLLAATNHNAKNGEQYGPRFNFRGHPKICRIAPLALNSDARAQLWSVSEKLIESFVDITQGKKLLSRK